MNLASWIILGVVAVIVGLAIRATFFGKKRGGCCDCGDPQEKGCAPSACDGCPSCPSCNHARH